MVFRIEKQHNKILLETQDFMNWLKGRVKSDASIKTYGTIVNVLLQNCGGFDIDNFERYFSMNRSYALWFAFKKYLEYKKFPDEEIKNIKDFLLKKNLIESKVPHRDKVIRVALKNVKELSEKINKEGIVCRKFKIQKDNDKYKIIYGEFYIEKEIKYKNIIIYPNDISFSIKLQYELGCRIRELILMKNNSFKGENLDTIDIKEKGNNWRTIVLTTDEIKKEAINRLLNRDDSNFFLFDKINRSNENEIRALYVKIYNIIRWSGIYYLKKEFSTHWFRYARIMDMLNEGYDIRTIQKFTGHSSLDILERYLKEAGIESRELANKEKKRIIW